MGDKGEGEVKNLKKWVTSFMDGPLLRRKRGDSFSHIPFEFELWRLPVGAAGAASEVAVVVYTLIIHD